MVSYRKRPVTAHDHIRRLVRRVRPSCTLPPVGEPAPVAFTCWDAGTRGSPTSATGCPHVAHWPLDGCGGTCAAHIWRIASFSASDHVLLRAMTASASEPPCPPASGFARPSRSALVASSSARSRSANASASWPVLARQRSTCGSAVRSHSAAIQEHTLEVWRHTRMQRVNWKVLENDDDGRVACGFQWISSERFLRG